MTPAFENISKDHVLKVFSFSKDFFELNWHYHTEYELTLILEGKGKRFLGSSAEDFEELDLVLIGSRIPHTWKSEPCKSKVKALVIHFSEAAFRPIAEITEFSQLIKWIDLSVFGLKISVNDKILKKILELEKLDGGLKIIRFYELLLLLYEQKSRKILAEAYEIDYSKKHQRIHFVLNYLEHHYQNPCKIENLASLVNLTESGFAKFFKNQTGICYSQYLNQLRIKKSKKLLTETDQSIKEIYTNIGFENQAYFNRVFRRMTSLSPKEYRSRHWK